MLKIFRNNKPSKDPSIYKRLVGFDAYYSSDSNQKLIAFLADFICHLPDFGFRITTVIDEEDKPYEKYCKDTRLINTKNGLICKDDFSPEAVFYFPKSHSIQSISLWFEYEPERLKKIEERLVRHENLLYATLYSQHDNKWQDEKQILTYKMNNQSLKGKEFTKDIFDKNCIDVRKNYGRTVKEGEICYIAGFRMWFGVDFQFISREKLKLIPSVHQKLIEYNILEIQLLERLISDNYETNRMIQKEFIDLIEKTTANMQKSNH